MSVSAQDVQISGVVNSSGGTPIAGAIVTIHGLPEYYGISDASGAYTIPYTSGVRAPYNRLAQQSFATLCGNRITFDVSTGEEVRVSLYTLQGRSVFSAPAVVSSQAFAKVTTPEVGAGFYLLEITAKGRRAAFKQFFSSQRTFTISRAALRSESTSKRAIAKRASASDRLVAVANGYTMSSVSIDSYIKEVNFTLEPSTQWIPAGSAELEHSGGMVKILAAGRSFMMGSPVALPPTVSLPFDLEQPCFPVSFTYDFWMDTTEVTQKRFSEVMSAGYSDFSGMSWSANYGLGDNIPAHSLSFGDAILYCNALSKAEALDTVYSYSSRTTPLSNLSEVSDLIIDMTKPGYRLPTEQEFEYAARGGTVTDFFWNKNYRPYPATAADTAEISQYCVWSITSDAGSEQPGYALRAGVASRLPNAYGLYDIMGGCGEFVHIPITNWEDADNALQYPSTPQTDIKPQPVATDITILPRGGNWGNGSHLLRSACRFEECVNYNIYFRGFRVVKEVR